MVEIEHLTAGIRKEEEQKLHNAETSFAVCESFLKFPLRESTELELCNITVDTQFTWGVYLAGRGLRKELGIPLQEYNK